MIVLVRSHMTMKLLEALGGAEIAALVGVMLEASDTQQRREQKTVQDETTAMPVVVVDGFIVTTAALVAVHIPTGSMSYLVFGNKIYGTGTNHGN